MTALVDPFADTPAEEAPAAPEVIEIADEQPKKAAPKKAAPKTAEEGKLTVTLKGGSGYDAPWIVGHFADVDDALRTFSEDAVKMADLMTRVQKAGAHFSGLQPARENPVSANPSRPPQGATDAPAWAPPKPFDDFVYKTGVSKKTGKVWHAWMPPQQGDSRDAKFFYQN